MIEDDCTCITHVKQGFTWIVFADPQCPEHGPCQTGWHNPRCVELNGDMSVPPEEVRMYDECSAV